ncbi:hypothetical protein NDU88_004558 [Pleurodeles waltl]|uniref:Peptidase A2 domain-containing protein n=1 Tax=Pleurodeles waltl TaxID=8319 RepID=A0AAV7M7H1_PLEWA|nr:hypothetical protein NDU88_004558 [Pleurodeles waltl]
MIDNAYATSNEDENVILMLACSSQEDNGSVEISSVVATRKRNPPSCVVSVNGKDVKFLADSGSPLTLVCLADCMNIGKMVVQDSHIKNVAYGGKSIEVVGKFEATLKFGSKCAVESDDKSESVDKLEIVCVVNAIGEVSKQALTEQEWISACLDDGVLQEVKSYIRGGWPNAKSTPEDLIP